MIACKFSDVSERDMDLLFLEEMVSMPEFFSIFLSKIHLDGAKILKAEHSKVDVELGESDMTILVKRDEVRYGLLIEDKIDAIAMENQYDRYVKRGERGKENNEYDEYFIFIVAPKTYLETNAEAKKYPYQVMYEECLAYFNSQNDARSAFKAQQMIQAIHKQKVGYQVIENAAVTAFWREYAVYQKTYYPQLNFKDKCGPKGSRAKWMNFHTDHKNIHIYHKTESGCVDLEFSGLGGKMRELKILLRSIVGNLKHQDICVRKTGKAAVLRVEVPVIDVKADFLKQKQAVESAMNAVERLYQILDDIPEDILQELFLQ